MKPFAVVLFFLTIGFQINAQSNWQQFKKQSCPIKTWVLLHPFKAKKAYEISMEAQKVADSIAKTNLLDKDKTGGQVDAFRHAYWMARLHQEIGKSAARSLGKAYEKDNYLTYKKQKHEDGISPDKVSKEMDLYNNSIGLTFTQKKVYRSNIGLIYKIANAIKGGRLKIIKKDKEGNYLTCEGELIPPEELLHAWETNKCLIPSNK